MERPSPLPTVLRLLASLGLLAVVLWWLEPDTLAAAFAAPQPAWLALALVLSIPQVLLSAWRWQLTAARLGVPLGFARAVREYYLATFLNQVLPGGVMGDAARAWRHGRDTGPGTINVQAAWQAVVIERASGQAALLLVVLATLLLSPTVRALPDRLLAAPAGGAALPMLAAAALVVGVLVARRARGVLLGFARAIGHALLAREVFLRQLLASLLVIASYVAIYLCCMRMIGIDTPLAGSAPLVPWVLLAMAIPLSVAGWGIREGAAALIWHAAGLDAAEGVAISVCYGVVVLLSSLPGVLALRAPAEAARTH
ncbi:MAG: lysylphosphatidylglycerol synthase transmembrane domain-containing protein [Thauera sp.]